MELVTQNHAIKNITILRANLAYPQKIIEKLLSCGYEYKPDRQKFLIKYLNSLGSGLPLFKISKKTGFHEDSFLMPYKTYGDNSICFQSVENTAKNSEFTPKGTLEDWKQYVAIPSMNSSRLIFAIGCAFAAPLLDLLEIEGGGFHFFGETSTGKTLLLKVAASVMGKPSKIIQRWRATANALESIAQSHNHLLLLLDEIAQADSRDIGNIAYMLSNGQCKARANCNGDAKSIKTWKTLYLSTGEVTISDTISQSGKSIKGGQENRLPDIPACPSKGFGAFESYNGYKTSSELVKALEEATAQYWGSPMDAFLEKLIKVKTTEWIQSQKKRLINLSEKLTQNIESDNAVNRVAVRFALIELALFIASEWNIVPFNAKQINQSTKTLFDDWISNRGGTGNIEIKEAVKKIRILFQSHIYSNRIIDITNCFQYGTCSSKLLAYKKDDELLVPTLIFDKEFCVGVSKKELIKALQDDGLLKISTSKDRNTSKRRIDGKPKEYYIFNDYYSKQNLLKECIIQED